MRLIKKYANRKMYDTHAKQYIGQSGVAGLIKKGEAVRIVEHTTGEDITAAVVSRLLGDENGPSKQRVPTNLLVQLLRRGGDTLTDYARKYTSLWQHAFTMAEDEIDRLVNHLVKNKEIPLSEAKKVKKELSQFGEHLKSWLSEKIDLRVNEILNRMNLVTKDDIKTLTDRMEKVQRQIAQLEKKSAHGPTRRKRK